MKKNVILTWASYYSYYELQPFVESWKENITDAELCIFYINFSEYTKRYLKKMGVNLIALPFMKIDEFHRSHHKMTSVLYSAMNEFLINHYDRYEAVLLTDIRDVVLQKNLFAEKNQEGWIRFSSEGRPILSNNVNSEWMTYLCGNDDWKNDIGDKEIINGGICCGSVREMVAFNEFLLNSPWRDKFYGWDQAVRGYLIHNNLIECKNVKIDNPCSDGIVSLAVMSEGYSIDNGYIVNKYGNVPCAVHQYDRIPKLADFVNHRYRNLVYCDSFDGSDPRSVLEIVKSYILFGEYKKALITSLLLKKSEEVVDYSLLMSVILELIQKCNSHKNDKMIPLIELLVWKYAIDVFCDMPEDVKKNQLDSYISCLNAMNSINHMYIEDFIEQLWKMLQRSVEMKDWEFASKIIESTGSLLKKYGVSYYLCASEVYRHLKQFNEAFDMYRIALNRECRSIYHLETHFGSFLYVKGSHIYGRPIVLFDHVINYNLNNIYPLCFFKTVDGCVLFILKQNEILYVQSIGVDGSITLGKECRLISYISVGSEKVSFVLDDNKFLTSLFNGEVGVAPWCRAWESFKLIPCVEDKLYLLSNILNQNK